MEGGEPDSLATVDDDYLGDNEHLGYEGGDGDLEEIKYQEKYHFTCKRMGFMLINFIILLANNMIVKNKDTTS